MTFDFERWRATLPVAEAVPRVRSALAMARAAVLCAPPGAGKTSLVPLALLDAAWLGGGRILMLAPRRLAARAAARRMADMLGERVGETVGYRTRLDSRIGPGTRIEVLTEGILLRMIEDDPALERAGLVIFDEFHERSLDSDLGLALVLDTRRHLRDELRILIMSATLEADAVAHLLGGAPVIASAGRTHDVTVTYLGRPAPEQFDRAVTDAIRRALAEGDGSVLVFLPGGAEIRRSARLLRDEELSPEIVIAPLYGDLPHAAQDEAIRPPQAGRRKIVLATSIAETSLTIEDIRAVVDCGLARVPRFEPASGMTRLETVRVSQASAEQRRGRAGRLAPGRCYRLWRQAEQAQLAPYNRPEMLEADMTPLALVLASWGNADPAAYAWLDPPPGPALAEAQTLLQRLAALDEAGRITAHGRRMARFGLPPRLAHMILQGKERGSGALACALAALLVERDVLSATPGARDVDLRLRIELLLERGRPGQLPAGLAPDRNATERARQGARQYRRLAGISGEEASDVGETGAVLAQAYPDRIAQRRPDGQGQFRLANGRGAFLPAADALAREEFLAIAELDGDRQTARIHLAAPLPRRDLEADFASQTIDTIAWDAREEAVAARRTRRFDALVLRDDPLADPPAERVASALIDGIRSLGLTALPWHGAAQSLRERLAFLGRLEPQAEWPDVADAALLGTMEIWLAPFLAGVRRRSQLAQIDLATALRGLLDPDQARQLDRLAPTHVAVPSGSRIAIDYGSGEAPVLAVKLQEMFGARVSPAIAAGRVPLVLHLLSPAGRPLQVTRDLASFWQGSYPEIRRQMRGRYPRHPWPENPFDAPPTARATPRGRAVPSR